MAQVSADEVRKMDQSEKQELEERVHQGETVVQSGTGGKSLDAQVNLATGRSKGGQSRSSELGHEGYQEMGKKGGLSNSEQSGGEAAEAKNIDIDESKFTKNK
eukprot:jgi/Mesen1/3704/ME000202S02789